MSWSLSDLLRVAAISADIRGDASITGLAHSSKAVGPGDLFSCMPGQVVDGHDYAAAAVESGAVALLVERFLLFDVAQARVERVRDVQGDLASTFFGRPSQDMLVAGVTGTNGKTTITYLVESIALAAGKRTGVIGTIERRFADVIEAAPRNTPEAVDVQHLLRRMADAGTDLVAMEATSDGLAQGRLRGTRFATAAFTNLTQDHLNTHGSMEAYFDAKAMLFSRDYTDRAVINIDSPYGRRLVELSSDLHVTTYGINEGDISCEDVSLGSTGSRATVRTPAGTFELVTRLVGAYNVSNCLCAIGMALDCGIALDSVAQGVSSIGRVPGRLERVDAGQPFLALVDYAHTPDALEQALRACRELATGRLIVVFGCGGDRDRAKRPLMGEAATRIADLSFITSDNPRSEDPAAIVSEVEVGARRGSGEFRSVVDRREAIADALASARPGDVVLVAGKGHEQGQQFADRTLPFDDRDVVREHLEALCQS
jgi:UDP-N-acetylmuramoyl-L-alanyl-D-glutamate--2,6-diaminopimelate ligase